MDFFNFIMKRIDTNYILQLNVLSPHILILYNTTKVYDCFDLIIPTKQIGITELAPVTSQVLHNEKDSQQNTDATNNKEC